MLLGARRQPQAAVRALRTWSAAGTVRCDRRRAEHSPGTDLGVWATISPGLKARLALRGSTSGNLALDASEKSAARQPSRWSERADGPRFDGGWSCSFFGIPRPVQALLVRGRHLVFGRLMGVAVVLLNLAAVGASAMAALLWWRVSRVGPTEDHLRLEGSNSTGQLLLDLARRLTEQSWIATRAAGWTMVALAAQAASLLVMLAAAAMSPALENNEAAPPDQQVGSIRSAATTPRSWFVSSRPTGNELQGPDAR